MKIKQVEELVGINKKNIRFYEQLGLLKVNRLDNGYREYSLEDCNRLKMIKFLRKLDVSTKEIQELFDETISLESCLNKQRNTLKKKQEDLEMMNEYIDELLKSEVDLHQVDTYLEQMEKFEKKGANFMSEDIKVIHRKKIIGAFSGMVVISLILILLISIIIYGNSVEPLPKPILFILIGIIIFVFAGIVHALITRIKEIVGGNEDEASKY